MLSVASASAPALAQPAPPTPIAPPTVNEIAAGDKAARTKDWEGALTHYQAALHATPSWRAQLGVADALYQLGRLGESYETYDDAQRTYGTKYGPGEKGLVGVRLKELATKTGWLSIRVADAGADVELDGKSIGTSPVPALVRVAVGSHGVHVTKAGFAAFAGRAEVPADGKAVVDVALTPQATQGHVIVHANGNDVLRVTIDGRAGTVGVSDVVGLARSLEEAGVAVELLDFAGLVHGFLGLGALSAASAAATDAVWAAFAALLGS